MGILYSLFGSIMRFCYMIVPNYAVAILLLAILMKIVLLPFSIKQQKNMQKQASLRPKEMAIRKRYAGRTDQATQQKMQADIMELYQKENYSMFGGCLPLLLQFPIIIALYNVIRNPLTYLVRLGEYVAPIKDRITELGLGDVSRMFEIDMVAIVRDNFDKFKDVLPAGFEASQLPSFKVFGIFDLAQTPSFSDKSWLLLIPVLTFLAAFFSMKLTRKFSYQPPQMTEQGGNSALSMKIMDLTMPLVSVWITFTVPAVVGVYWIYQNILATLQQFILTKIYKFPEFTEEDYKRIEKEMNGNIKKEKKKKEKVRSLHNIDEDDYDDPQPENTASRIADDAPPLKEDRSGERPKRKGSADGENGAKKEIRSLHHIDDEDYED